MSAIKSLILLLLIASTTFAAELRGKATVIDGDTIKVESHGKTYKVRIAGIDAPETKQPGGKEATEKARELIEGKEVRVEWKAKDRYGRILGTVMDDMGRDIAAELVHDGLAWGYRARRDSPIARSEADARQQHRGIWQSDKPQPPWEWRKEQREKARVRKVKQ